MQRSCRPKKSKPTKTQAAGTAVRPQRGACYLVQITAQRFGETVHYLTIYLLFFLFAYFMDYKTSFMTNVAELGLEKDTLLAYWNTFVHSRSQTRL